MNAASDWYLWWMTAASDVYDEWIMLLVIFMVNEWMLTNEWMIFYTVVIERYIKSAAKIKKKEKKVQQQKKKLTEEV